MSIFIYINVKSKFSCSIFSFINAVIVILLNNFHCILADYAFLLGLMENEFAVFIALVAFFLLYLRPFHLYLRILSSSPIQ